MIKAILFDFDGVIVDSVEIKTEAFRDLFCQEAAEDLERILDYHKAHGGISRAKKIEYFYANILRRPLDGKLLKELEELFSGFVKNKVIAAPFLKGSREFLSAHHKSFVMHVVSGTPQLELEDIVVKRGLSGYFKSIHGSPPGKKEIIRALIEKSGYKTEELVFIGDSMDDADSAVACGVSFIHLGADRYDNAPFKEKGLAVAEDFKKVEELLAGRNISK